MNFDKEVTGSNTSSKLLKSRRNPLDLDKQAPTSPSQNAFKKVGIEEEMKEKEDLETFFEMLFKETQMDDVDEIIQKYKVIDHENHDLYNQVHEVNEEVSSAA